MGLNNLIKRMMGLEKEAVEFIEEEFLEIEEEIEGNQSKYTEIFQGDILGKNDPYEQDIDDHGSLSLESAIPMVGQDAKWFTAVKSLKNIPSKHDALESNQDERADSTQIRYRLTQAEETSEDEVGSDQHKTGNFSRQYGQNLDAETPQAMERELLKKKGPSLMADLNHISKQGQTAKELKEILKGIRRTLQKPHKLYKNSKRLNAVRSGDPETFKLSLKRYGRSIEPMDDADPEDISNDSEKLSRIQKHHRNAIRHMVDLGQQYGKDPFDGDDPEEIQAIIEYYAAKHPHRRHKRPYVPSEYDDNLNSFDTAVGNQNANFDLNDDIDHNDDDLENLTYKVDEEDDNTFLRYGGEGDLNNNSQDDTIMNIQYPDLEKAVHGDIDHHNEGIPLNFHKKKKQHKKRRYPKPYKNDKTPNDIQLAYDELLTIFMNADDGESLETPSLHKKHTHAAKRLLKHIHHIRSFQNDPFAYEGAFVDDASAEGCRVAGLDPSEIESRYYTLKKSYSPYHKKHKQHHFRQSFNGSDGFKHYDDKDPINTEKNDPNKDEIDNYTGMKKHHHHLGETQVYSGIHRHHTRGKHRHPDASNLEDISSYDEPNHQEQFDKNQDNNGVNSQTQPGGSHKKSSYYFPVDDQNSQNEMGNDHEIPDIEGSKQNEGYQNAQLNNQGTFSNDEDGMNDSGVTNGLKTSDDILNSVTSTIGLVDNVFQSGNGFSKTNFANAMTDNAGSIAGLFGADQKTQQTVQSAAGLANAMFQVENGLSQTENIGAQAQSVSNDVGQALTSAEDVEGAGNLCSNPTNLLTKGDNILSKSQNISNYINQSLGLIQGGQTLISQIANGASVEDIMNSSLNLTLQGFNDYNEDFMGNNTANPSDLSMQNDDASSSSTQEDSGSDNEDQPEDLNANPDEESKESN